jgi:hypothetical protein
MYFKGWVCHTAAYLKKDGGIQVLVGLAPSSQTVGSLLKNHCPAKYSIKKFVRQIYFNSKRHLTTFDQINSAFLSFNKVGLYPFGTLNDFIISEI